MVSDQGLILLTGATGYVGGRLLDHLQERGLPVRCLVRRPEHLEGRTATTTEVVRGDLLDEDSLPPAFAGADTAYYLVHSLGSGRDFEQREQQCALNFARAARAAGLRRIIYLGGLGDPGESLSPHLRSRQRVGELLHTTEVELVELRASVVIGSGSLSFEMIRALVERLPVMILPRWVSAQAQPIAIADLITYLSDTRSQSQEPGHRIYEIGGADQTSYEGLMREYARQRDLRRWMIRVPVLTPRLSSLWLGLVTPLFASVGRLLIESIRHATVVTDQRALDAFAIRPLGYRAAIAQALANEDREFARTHWSGALSSTDSRTRWGGMRVGTRLLDIRECTVGVSSAQAFAPIRRIGGRNGWYYANWLWRVRGWLDLLVGGVGMRRGRRNSERLRAGDVLDCWRVEAVQPDARLRLRAEMLLPGRAWLEFEVEDRGDVRLIRQTASFDPAGLFGRLYWYSLYLIHEMLFRGMLRRIAQLAEREGEGA